MVKIPELTNIQLVGQLEKYSKIMKQLTREREKRVSKNDSDDLYTKAELTLRQAQRSVTDNQEVSEGGENFLSFDEDELSAIAKEVSKTKVAEVDDDEEVRVTQLLKLSQSDLAELQNNKKKIKKKG